MSRNFAFLTEHNVALGMDTKRLDDDQSQITLSIAFCRDSGLRPDIFDPKVARGILNDRLDHASATTSRPARNTVQFTYQGSRPQVEVFYPLLDAIRNNVERTVELVLNNLAVVRGRVVQHTKDAITVTTAEGRVTVDLAHVKKIKHVRSRRKVDSLKQLLSESAATVTTVA